MSRTHRLFQMMQSIRRLPAPVTAAQLSEDLGKSVRTIYRDIETLRSLGAVIDGEAGFGFTLIEDASLPPLGFDNDELEALVLGLRNVMVVGDPALAKAAKTALGKIQSRVPERQSHRLKHAILDARRFRKPTPPIIDVSALREATWEEKCVSFEYVDGKENTTKRSVKPLGIVYMDSNNCLLGWCLLRKDFRAFRLDRMLTLTVTDQSFRPHRVSLLRDHLDLIRASADVAAQDHNAWT
jgi:predicted DNA-binding transcriptional regulator YafY